MSRIEAVLGNQDFKVEANIRQHRLIIDEPKDIGGQDEGPSPFELVGAGLAACTAATLRMYSKRKDWDFGEITVDVEYQRNAEQRSNTFIRHISLTGDLDEKQLSRALAIANACPVHKALECGNEIITELK